MRFKFWWSIFVCLSAVPAQAAERALMFDDNDVKVLTQILDAATRSGGIQIAPATVYILDKLNKAPVVTERKDADPAAAEKPKEPGQ